MISIVTRFLYYTLSFFLAFGSANPFRLDTLRDVSDVVSSQFSLSPFFFVGCFAISLLDQKVIRRIGQMKKYFFPLILLFIFILLGDVLYNSAGPEVEVNFYIKLLIAIAGFVVFSVYFSIYPKVMEQCLQVFAWTCSLIIVAYFLGFFNKYSYFSNGRLWLFGENPNSFSFLMGIGALVHLYSSVGIRKWRLLHLASVLVIILYIILSGSRGSFIMCLFSMLLVVYPAFKRKTITAAIVFIAIALIAFWGVQVETDQINFIERMETLTQEDERRDLMSNAISLFKERPLQGFGRYGYVTERFVRFNDPRDSHNLIVSSFVMGGLVAGISMVYFLLLLFKKTWRVSKISIIPLALFTYVFLIAMKTGEIITYSMMWFMFAVIFAFAEIESNV